MRKGERRGGGEKHSHLLKFASLVSRHQRGLAINSIENNPILKKNNLLFFPLLGVLCDALWPNMSP